MELELTEKYEGEPGEYVKQNCYKIRPVSVPLATSGLGPCIALILINKVSGLHYLAHIDSTSTISGLKKSFQDLRDQNNTEIYIMEGTLPDPELLNMILNCLHDEFEEHAGIWFLKSSEISPYLGLYNSVVIHNGQVLDAPETTRNWTEKDQSMLVR